MTGDYTQLTEIAGSKITREQLQRMYNRYAFAAELSIGKDVLEVACGVGQGLGLLGHSANSVVAGDYTQQLVELAKEHYGERFDVRQFDAQNMPFRDASFNVVVIYEAIYYLSDPYKFLDECHRVLRPGGRVIICTANKDWPAFAKSPSSHCYFSAPELYDFLDRRGFRVNLYGDCPVEDESLRGVFTSVIRKAVVKLNLMPRNMKSKEKFKRIFFGKLIDMPAELQEGMVEYTRPVPISHMSPNRDYKVIFAVGELK